METTFQKYNFEREYSVFIFDLDNTLYNECDYLFSGYKAISDYIETKCHNHTSAEYYDFLTSTYNQDGRSGLFDKLITHYNLQIEINKLTDILHSHHTEIKLNIQAKELLDYLIGKDKKVYVLTNGNIKQQQNKVELLGINRQYPTLEVIYANSITPKPSPISLLMIIKKENVKQENVLFIGDSEVDELTAKNANVDFLFFQNIKKCI